MDPLSRRRLLAVGGMAALAGCSGDVLSGLEGTETDRQTSSTPPATSTATQTPEPTSDGRPFEAVLETIPQTIGEKRVQQLQLFEPLPADAEQSPSSVRGGIADSLGLEPAQIDHAAVALYPGEYAAMFSVVGEFDAEEPTVPDGGPSETEVHREDGVFLGASRQEGGSWTEAIEAAEAAMADDVTTVADDENVRQVLEPLGGVGRITVVPEYPPETSAYGTPAGIEAENLSTVAIGRRRVGEDTVEATIVTLFDEKSAVDEAVLQQVVEQTTQADEADASVKQDGRRLVGTTTFEVRTGGPADGPDTYFHVSFDDETGEIVVRHAGGEELPTETLSVSVGDETVDASWDRDTVSEGDVLRIEGRPFSPVVVEWTDPEDGETTVISSSAATPRDAFEGSFDPDADTVTFRYTATHTAPTDTLELQIHEIGTNGPTDEDTRSLSMDELSTGDEIVVEDVQYGKRVLLWTSVETAHGSRGSSVAHVSTRPPGRFTFDQDTDEMVYVGEQAQPASHYRITVDGEPASTQFADEYETLSEDDAIGVSAETGQTIVVEWVGEDGPIEVHSRRVRPDVSFDLTRNSEAFQVVYTGSQSVDADEYAVRTGMDDQQISFADEFDTLTDGDAISLDPADVRYHVGVRWVGGDEPLNVFGESIHQLARFEFGSDGDQRTLTFVGEGEWPAEEFAVQIGGESVGTDFASEYDTITAGDSIPIDAATGTNVAVEWTVPENPIGLFSKQVHPPFDFDFEYDEEADELTVVSAAGEPIDASELTITVYAPGESTERSAWSDTAETVENGDSVTIETPAQIQVVVIRHEGWRASVAYEPDGE